MSNYLFALFTLIILWEELWDLPNTAYLSAWLLLIITAGAMICSVIFERRFWCRYLCPIGGMNGLFANFPSLSYERNRELDQLNVLLINVIKAVRKKEKD